MCQEEDEPQSTDCPAHQSTNLPWWQILKAFKNSKQKQIYNEIKWKLLDFLRLRCPGGNSLGPPQLVLQAEFRHPARRGFGHALRGSCSFLKPAMCFFP